MEARLIECWDIPIKAPLVFSAKQFINLLKAVDNRGDLYEGPTLDRAVRQYESYWLPYLAKYQGNSSIVPPLQIQWVWCLHMLDPAMYKMDCTKLLKSLLDHQFCDDRLSAVGYTQLMWEDDQKGDVPFEDPEPPEGEQLVSRGIQAIAAKMHSFYYQASLPHFSDVVLLDLAAERYKKYLHLLRMHPDEFLIPCIDILLIWYAHKMTPRLYASDTYQILQKVTQPDDGLFDVTLMTVWSDPMGHTRNRWREIYSEEFIVAGSLYRGSPLAGSYYELTPMETWAISQKRCVVILRRIFISNVPTNLTHPCFQLKFSDGRIIKKGSLPPGDVAELYINQQIGLTHGSIITCEITDKKRALFSYHVAVGSVNIKVSFDMGAKSGAVYKASAGFTTKAGFPETSVCLEMTMVPSPSPAELNIECGPFMLGEVPEWVPQILPLPPRESSYQVRGCNTAMFKVYDQNKQLGFTCQLLHVTDVELTLIQVLYKGRMTALAYMIGKGTLPTSNYVSHNSSVLSLDAQSGERAMLIRGAHYDWGVCTAKLHHEDSGRQVVQMRIHELGKKTKKGAEQRLKKLHQVRIPLPSNNLEAYHLNSFESCVVIEGTSINLHTGKVDVDVLHAEQGAIPEILALAFSLSILFEKCCPLVLKPLATVFSSGVMPGRVTGFGLGAGAPLGMRPTVQYPQVAPAATPLPPAMGNHWVQPSAPSGVVGAKGATPGAPPSYEWSLMYSSAPVSENTQNTQKKGHHPGNNNNHKQEAVPVDLVVGFDVPIVGGMDIGSPGRPGSPDMGYNQNRSVTASAPSAPNEVGSSPSHGSGTRDDDDDGDSDDDDDDGDEDGKGVDTTTM